MLVDETRRLNETSVVGRVLVLVDETRRDRARRNETSVVGRVTCARGR